MESYGVPVIDNPQQRGVSIQAERGGCKIPSVEVNDLTIWVYD